jgi:hypothetical protein
MIFDTDVLIWVQRGSRKAARLVDLSQRRCVSVLTLMELLQCARDRMELQRNKSFLKDLAFETFPLTENVGHRAAIYVEQYALSHGMRAADAIIAATAAEAAVPLATANVRHFRHLSEIELVPFRP